VTLATAIANSDSRMIFSLVVWAQLLLV